MFLIEYLLFGDMDAARIKYLKESQLRIDKAIALKKAQNAQNELDRLARQRQQNLFGYAPIGMMPVCINGCIMYVPVQSGYRPMQWP